MAVSILLKPTSKTFSCNKKYDMQITLLKNISIQWKMFNILPTVVMWGNVIC